MNNKIFLFLAFLGIIGFSVSCEKDETKVILTNNPVLPKIVTIPDLAFVKTQAKDTIVFVCSPLDLGFSASTKYYLEACVSGKEFVKKEIMQIYFGNDYAEIKTTVDKLNKAFKGKKIVAGVVSAVDFRVRAVLTLNAGDGGLGTNANPLQYISETITDSTSIY